MTPAGAEVAAHHPLDAGGERDVRVRETLMDAIRDRPVVVEAGEYLFYGMKYIIQAIDIQECFLLAGKGGLGQVLGRRRRAHGPGGCRRRVGKRPIGRREVRVERRAATARPRPSRGFRRRRAPAPRHRRRRARQAAPRCVSSSSLCARNSRKANAVVAKPPGTRMPASRELADHFAQRRVLAADLVDVAHPQAIEGNHPLRCIRHSCVRTSVGGRDGCCAAPNHGWGAAILARSAVRPRAMLQRKTTNPPQRVLVELRRRGRRPRGRANASGHRRGGHRRAARGRWDRQAPRRFEHRLRAGHRIPGCRPFTARRSVRYRSGCDDLR